MHNTTVYELPLSNRIVFMENGIKDSILDYFITSPDYYLPGKHNKFINVKLQLREKNSVENKDYICLKVSFDLLYGEMLVSEKPQISIEEEIDNNDSIIINDDGDYHEAYSKIESERLEKTIENSKLILSQLCYNELSKYCHIKPLRHGFLDHDSEYLNIDFEINFRGKNKIFLTSPDQMNNHSLFKTMQIEEKELYYKRNKYGTEDYFNRIIKDTLENDTIMANENLLVSEDKDKILNNLYIRYNEPSNGLYPYSIQSVEFYKTMFCEEPLSDEDFIKYKDIVKYIAYLVIDSKCNITNSNRISVNGVVDNKPISEHIIEKITDNEYKYISNL